MSDTKNSEKIPAEFKKPADFRIAPIRVFGSFEDYLADTEKLYGEAKEEYLASDVRAKDFPETCKSWEKVSRTMIMAAAALFGRNAADLKNKNKALELFQLCREDSGIREKGMMQHYELAKADEGVTPEERGKLRDKVLGSLEFFFRAANTQQRYLDRFVNSPDFISPEFQIEKERGPRVKALRKKIPAGHYFLPARPFPPERVPDWMNDVPSLPEAFQKFKDLPVEDYTYDAEHDEFALPEGYLSADGTIDDRSVVWDWENRTVTCRTVGGEPVTWPFWKPVDLGDTPKRGTWLWDYYRQLYKKVLKQVAPPGYYDS